MSHIKSLESLIRETVGELMKEESEASTEAKKRGLTYASFGRWKDPKTNKVVAVSHGGKLVDMEDADVTHKDHPFQELSVNAVLTKFKTEEEMESFVASKVEKMFKEYTKDAGNVQADPESYDGPLSGPMLMMNQYIDDFAKETKDKLNRLETKTSGAVGKNAKIYSTAKERLEYLSIALDRGRDLLHDLEYATLSDMFDDPRDVD